MTIKKKKWHIINQIAGNYLKDNNADINKIKQNVRILNGSINIAKECNKYFINVGNNIENNILESNFVKENW